jgi:heparanase 1
VVIHNTLAASDYGLLDQKTLIPRPNYWGALLWRRLMGTTVLDPGVEIAEGRHVYAHCLRDAPGGVTFLVINNSTTEIAVEMPLESKRYTLSAEPLQNGDVELNGAALKVDDSGDLPAIEGAATAAGSVSFAPGTIHVSGDRAVRKLRLPRFVNRRWMVGRAPRFSARRPSADTALCRRRAALPRRV